LLLRRLIGSSSSASVALRMALYKSDYYGSGVTYGPWCVGTSRVVYRARQSSLLGGDGRQNSLR